MKLKYAGGSNFRTITSDEFAGEGLEGAETFGVVRDGTVEVKSEIGFFLLAMEPGQWVDLTEPEPDLEEKAPVVLDDDASAARSAKKPSAKSGEAVK